MGLAWASVTAIGLSLLGRLVIALSVRGRVDWDHPGRRRRYIGGVLASLFEPLAGNRLIKTSFTQKDVVEGNTVWDPQKGSWVESDRDPVAVRAQNDWHTARNEVRNSMVLVGVEDVPELVVEIIYFVRTGVSVGDPLLIITALGTVLHIVRQVSEARALRAEIPGLRRTAEYRDKAFEQGATDEPTSRLAAMPVPRNGLG